MKDESTITKSSLTEAAWEVLRGNDLGHWTKPAPHLYPHQWSWDSAFIAIAYAHRDVDRGLVELETLFNAQWTDGRVPHIVFNPRATEYFPGPERWACSEVSAAACKDPKTSGLIQPPVHALAVWRLFEADKSAGGKLEPRFRALYPKLLAWHRYLAESRDPEKCGLISIYHPWESGTDNSPRWDESLARVKVGVVPPYTRHDTKFVADASERPTQAEYDRYLWLVECLKNAHYEDKQVYQQHPFIIKDALMSSIFALANRCLGRLAAAIDAPAAEREQIRHWEERTRNGLEKLSWNEELRLALDTDVKYDGAQIKVSTCAGLAPIVVPDFPHRIDTVCDRIMGEDFAGHKEFKFAVVPSTTPGTRGYHKRAYWRGPSWPVINWLYWYGMREHGFSHQAEHLRAANLAMLSSGKADYAEYFETFTGEPLGSLRQSWTAAVVVDWMSGS